MCHKHHVAREPLCVVNWRRHMCYSIYAVAFLLILDAVCKRALYIYLGVYLIMNYLYISLTTVRCNGNLLDIHDAIVQFKDDCLQELWSLFSLCGPF